MKHIWLLILALALVACGAAETGSATTAPDSAETVEEAVELPTAAPTPTELPDVEPTAEAVEEPDTTEQVDALDGVEETAEVEEEPTAEASQDATVGVFDASEAALTPADAMLTRSNDYFKGAADPDVVLVEYGDFQ